MAFFPRRYPNGLGDGLSFGEGLWDLVRSAGPASETRVPRPGGHIGQRSRTMPDRLLEKLTLLNYVDHVGEGERLLDHRLYTKRREPG